MHMLRKSLLAGAFVAAAGTAAMAADATVWDAPQQGSPLYAPTSVVNAHVDLSIGFISGDGNSVGIFNGFGRIAFPLVDKWKAQVDAIGVGAFGDFGGGTGGAILHLYHESPTYALGVLGGAAFGQSSDPLFIIGGEGNWYWNQWVASGRATYSAVNGDAFATLDGALEYYTNPDHMVGGYFYYATAVSGGSGYFGGVGITGEMMLPKRHASVYGRLGGVFSSVSSGVEGVLGLRLYAPSGNSLEAERRLVPMRYALPFFDVQI